MIYRYLIVFITFLSCGRYPKDPNNTLVNVQNHTLRVGVADTKAVDGVHSPLAGPDSIIIHALARQLKAKVSWTTGTQADLVELLKKGELDIAVGGFTAASPFQQETGFTKPYKIETFKAGALPGEPAPKEIEGRQVVVKDPLVAAFVKEKGGVPVRKDSFGTTDVLVAATEKELHQMGRRILPVELHTKEHVMAVQKGENAFLMEVEKLIDRYGATQ